MPRQTTAKFDPVVSRGVAAVLLLVAAAIIILSFFGQAGVVGIMLDNYILSSIFGQLRYAVPLVLLVIGWFLVKDIDYDYRATHGIGAVLFFVSAASLLHLGFPPEQMWKEALLGHGGGIVGMAAWPLATYLGTVGSGILLLGIIIVSLLLMVNTAIVHFVMIHKKIISGLGAMGRAVVIGTKALFLKSGNKGVKIHDDYPESADLADENDAADLPSRSRFAVRQLGEGGEEAEKNEGNQTTATPEEDQKEETTSEPTEPAAGPWTKKVIIKDLPPLTLLNEKRSKPTSGDIKANAQIIEDTLREFGIDVDMGEIRVGPTVTQYSLKPHKGVKLSRITTLSNDLSLALAAHPIRIEAPIPGKSLVGIEVPNQKTALVTLRELLDSKEFTERPHHLMIGLGKDVAGKIWFADLPRMPHLLVAGTTGSGKTVCINTILMSLLYENTAETLRMILVDPKRVELTLYNGIPHLLTPVITNVPKTVNALKWAIGEMDRRFELLSQSRCRDISSYNQTHRDKIPHIIFVIDELADLMAAAAGEVEAGIIRLAQMARAVGIHLIVATQRPSVDVITGLMKANIPTRIAFSVASLIDSRTILDSPGAEKLLGRGDMLFLTSELSKPVRIQGAFISEDELKNVVEYLRGDEEPTYDETIVDKPTAHGTMSMFGGPGDDQDALFSEAKASVIQAGKASASFLQRKFKIGYARAARILDELEAAGIIGPGDGAKPREILVTTAEISDTMDAGGELNVFDEDSSVANQESEQESEKI